MSSTNLKARIGIDLEKASNEEARMLMNPGQKRNQGEWTLVQFFAHREMRDRLKKVAPCIYSQNWPFEVAIEIRAGME